MNCEDYVLVKVSKIYQFLIKHETDTQREQQLWQDSRYCFHSALLASLYYTSALQKLQLQLSHSDRRLMLSSVFMG